MDAINIHQTIRTKLNVLIEANYDLNETEDRPGQYHHET